MNNCQTFNVVCHKKNQMKYYLLSIFTMLIISCLNKEKNNILTIGKGNDVEVTLNIKDKKNIKKIEFHSGVNNEFIYRKHIESSDVFIYNF